MWHRPFAAQFAAQSVSEVTLTSSDRSLLRTCMSAKPKKPRDVNQNAYRIFEEMIARSAEPRQRKNLEPAPKGETTKEAR